MMPGLTSKSAKRQIGGQVLVLGQEYPDLTPLSVK
jgi:hypothetical protein